MKKEHGKAKGDDIFCTESKKHEESEVKKSMKRSMNKKK
jgi:hypothetical protein